MSFIVSVIDATSSNATWWDNFVASNKESFGEWYDYDDSLWSTNVTELLSKYNGWDVTGSETDIGFETEQDYLLFVLKWA